VVGLLNELEERELVTRRRDRSDRRRHIVELSPRGEDELHLAYAQLNLVENDLLSDLAPRKRRTSTTCSPRYRVISSPCRFLPTNHPPAQVIQHTLLPSPGSRGAGLSGLRSATPHWFILTPEFAERASLSTTCFPVAPASSAALDRPGNASLGPPLRLGKRLEPLPWC